MYIVHTNCKKEMQAYGENSRGNTQISLNLLKGINLYIAMSFANFFVFWSEDGQTNRIKGDNTLKKS